MPRQCYENIDELPIIEGLKPTIVLKHLFILGLNLYKFSNRGNIFIFAPSTFIIFNVPKLLEDQAHIIGTSVHNRTSFFDDNRPSIFIKSHDIQYMQRHKLSFEFVVQLGLAIYLKTVDISNTLILVAHGRRMTTWYMNSKDGIFEVHPVRKLND